MADNESSTATNLSGFVFGIDVLSATKFKPWWETLRFYASAGLLVLSLLIVYTMNPSTSVVCLPVGNGTSEFDKIGADHVSLHCSKFEPSGWFFRNVGYFAVCAALIINLLYNWWLLVPRVRFTFISLRKYDDICDKINDVDDLDGTEVEKLEATDEAKKVDLENTQSIAISRMNNFKPLIPLSVPTIYVTRNLLALIAICVNIYVLYIIMHYKEVPFFCVIQSVTAKCKYDVIEQLKPFVFVGIILLCLAGIISLIAVVVTVLYHCIDDLPAQLDEKLYRKRDYAFAVYFGEHSSPIS